MTLPHWLDPTCGVAAPKPLPRSNNKATRRAQEKAFALSQLAVLTSLGVGEFQRFELLGITFDEADRGRSSLSRLHNVVGQKAKEDVAAWFMRRFGYPLRWVEMPGHTRSGDPALVHYAVFTEDRVCWQLLLERVFGPNPYAHDYRDAAQKLQAGDLEWINALIEAGYRGDVTKAHPDVSIAAHRRLVTELRVLVA